MKKLLTILFLFLMVGNGYCATQLKKTVKPSGGDYTTLEACMNDNEQDLVTADKYFDVEIDGAWAIADTTVVTIHNYTNVTSTTYINIYTTSTARHNGKAAAVSGRSSYRRIFSTLNKYNMTISNYYVTINGIEFQNTHASYGWGLLILVDNQAHYNTIKNCIFHDSISYPNVIDFTYSIYMKFYNNIIYNIYVDVANNGGNGIDAPWDTGTGEYYNNTLYNIDKIAINGGIQSGRSIIVKNNLCYNNGTDFARVFTASSNYNFSKDDTAPGANSIHADTDSKTPDFVSTTASSEDFHLQSSSDAIDVGTDLGSPYDTDIDGDTRSGTWDIGSDEYQAPTGGPYKLIFNNVQLN